MIIIKIENTTPTGITVENDGKLMPFVLNITIDGEYTSSENTYLARVAVINEEGLKTAQILKDHGFEVITLDYRYLDKDGNAFECLF